eukprot:m.235559 g.235559  ORF g.235559 m.235559 type:complete len:404 (+) comp26534_c2_seq3:297-1508(+)
MQAFLFLLLLTVLITVVFFLTSVNYISSDFTLPVFRLQNRSSSPGRPNKKIATTTTNPNPICPGKETLEERKEFLKPLNLCQPCNSSALSVLRTGPKIPVVIASEKQGLNGLVASMNSILCNTKADVIFLLVTLRDSEQRLRSWLTRNLPKAKFQIAIMDPSLVKGKVKIRRGRSSLKAPLNYARFFLPSLFPSLEGKFIFVDDDTIVRGDIVEFYQFDIKDFVIAVSPDANPLQKQLNNWGNQYRRFIRDAHPVFTRANLTIDPSTTSFNAGVFLANMTRWKQQNISAQLMYWLELNTVKNIFAAGGSQPPMMVVFYRNYATIDPFFHARGFGGTDPVVPCYPFPLLVSEIKLMHYTGGNKPWYSTEQWQKFPDSPLVFRDFFWKYAVPEFGIRSADGASVC